MQKTEQKKKDASLKNPTALQALWEWSKLPVIGLYEHVHWTSYTVSVGDKTL